MTPSFFEFYINFFFWYKYIQFYSKYFIWNLNSCMQTFSLVTLLSVVTHLLGTSSSGACSQCSMAMFFISTVTLQGYPHFTDERTEAQRG